MFVCSVPKVSQVMMKRRRRASHLGRNTLWHKGRRATQLGRFTLWHNGRRNLLKDERFERFCKHRSIVHLQQTLEICTLYEDRIKDLSKRLRRHESPRELVRQSEAKRKQAPQSEANVCRRRRHRFASETSLINCTGYPIMHRKPNTN